MTEFPDSGVWVYHQAQAPKLVTSQAELDYHLQRGWTREWQPFNTRSMVKAKIQELKAETQRMIDVLADMDEYDEPAPVAPLSVETVPVATDAPIAVAKKKGRPKKAA